MSAATITEAAAMNKKAFCSQLRFKIAEYYDLFWFDVLGRLPVIGQRLSEYHSDRNFRRD